MKSRRRTKIRKSIYTGPRVPKVLFGGKTPRKNSKAKPGAVRLTPLALSAAGYSCMQLTNISIPWAGNDHGAPLRTLPAQAPGTDDSLFAHIVITNATYAKGSCSNLMYQSATYQVALYAVVGKTGDIIDWSAVPNTACIATFQVVIAVSGLGESQTVSLISGGSYTFPISGVTINADMHVDVSGNGAVGTQLRIYGVATIKGMSPYKNQDGTYKDTVAFSMAELVVEKLQ